MVSYRPKWLKHFWWIVKDCHAQPLRVMSLQDLSSISCNLHGQACCIPPMKINEPNHLLLIGTKIPYGILQTVNKVLDLRNWSACTLDWIDEQVLVKKRSNFKTKGSINSLKLQFTLVPIINKTKKKKTPKLYFGSHKSLD